MRNPDPHRSRDPDRSRPDLDASGLDESPGNARSDPGPGDVQQLEQLAAQLRQANEQLLRSALREQEWAEDIEQARRALERRVAERTAELERTNAALGAEIMVRRAAEQAGRELLRQLIDAEEQERGRVSRELHDQMGQQLTGLLLGLRAAQEGQQLPPQLAERLRDLERLASETARDVQHMAMELRPPALDNLGLVAALQHHLDEWSTRHAIEHDFHAPGLDGARMPPEVETTSYRVVQEGLTNVVRHAAASRVSIVLDQRGGRLTVILEDDGVGFDVEQTLALSAKARRLGVRGMRERVTLLGGEFEIESSPGNGTTIFARIPTA